MRTLLILFTVFIAGPVMRMQAQVGVMDGVYVKENIIKRKQLYGGFVTHYFLPELLYPLNKELEETVAKINAEFPEKLLKIDDCVYFDAVARQCKGMTPGERKSTAGYLFSDHLPPSLRFSTDSNRNFVDSLFCVRLFPQVQLKKYLQPFYFKKTEVTNAEYREFVNYVRDSVTMRILAQYGYEDEYLLSEEQLLRKGIEDWKAIGDSIYGADSAKFYWPLNWKTEIRWDEKSEDYKMALDPIYKPIEERFWRRKEIDVRKLNYVYFTTENGKRNKHELNIYPDTLAWDHDVPYSFTEPMTNMYFWHPAYNDYPVVGITYYQAKAFLHWKTEVEQKKLDAKGSGYKVAYALPCEIEWEVAATSGRNGKLISSYDDFSSHYYDNSWLTDLMLDTSFQEKQSGRTLVDSVVYPEPAFDGAILLAGPSEHYLHTSDSDFVKNGKNVRLHKSWYEWEAPRVNFLVNYTFLQGADPSRHLFTTVADLSKVKPIEKYKKHTIDNSFLLTQIDNNGISHMGGNVSEWLEEDYSNWSPAIQTRLKMLQSVNAPDAQIEFMREHYFYSLLPKNGKLVRGANWFDQRYGNFGDKNPAGANAKTFVDPAKAHCTLGFRYVVHVTKK